MEMTFVMALFHPCLKEGNEGNLLKEMVDGHLMCLDYLTDLSRGEQASPNCCIIGVPFSNILSFLADSSERTGKIIGSIVKSGIRQIIRKVVEITLASEINLRKQPDKICMFCQDSTKH